MRKYYVCAGATTNCTIKVPSSSSKKGLEHTVTVLNGKVTCTCVGFKTHKHCKHSKKYIASCGWNEFIDGEAPYESNHQLLCPKCHRPVKDSGI